MSRREIKRMKEKGLKQVGEGKKSRESQKASHYIKYYRKTKKRRELCEIRKSYFKPLLKAQEN